MNDRSTSKLITSTVPELAKAAENIASMTGENERLSGFIEFQKIIIPTLAQLASAQQGNATFSNP